ncbi:unnamed protein product [Clonostachys solani]|uniref:Prion-inhibition and propagation HeLo domain-containing protein n=1 Tax=Clonostachys solani TaxID=160281 RepID=A0A9N9Z6Q0_9HYPO|nr:unnamed protein product [Clonostachys solani]
MAGPGLGSGSLILQVVDECVKYYKYFSEASKMPEKHRYLQIRLQLEQQRFLVFAEEAGLLSTETGSETLSINSTLLQETLSEIKMLFEKFQQANGKYVDIILSDGPGIKLSPQPSMMDLLCATQAPIAKIDISVAPTAKTSLRSNSIFRKIIWKARKLRTIMVEPKRLVWVAFDQKAFTSLIANLEVLNSALISLLHSSRSRRINQAIQTSYQEIIQMKTDLQGLEATIQAITYNTNQEEEDIRSVVTPRRSFTSQSITIETRSNAQRIKYMKELADVKFHRLDIGRSDESTSTPSHRDEAFEYLNITNSFPQECIPRTREIIHMNGEFLWLEPIDYSLENLDKAINDVSCVSHRASLLAKLLSIALPEDFRTPPCRGFIDLRNASPNTPPQPILRLVLKVPIRHDPLEVHIFSLREILSSQPMPSLSLRISLCCQLAECLSNFHAVDWLHKGLRSQNILFFGPDVGCVDLQKPYLTGLELSRPDGRPELTDVAKPNPEADLYRHPLVQGGENADAYRKSFDLYSLGVVLLEVACWSPIESIVGYKVVSGLTGDELRSIKDKILVDKSQAPLDSEVPAKSRCLEVVSAHAGDVFRDIVEILLCANEIESPAYPGEKAALRNRRLREAFAEGVVERLQKMREAL